MLSICIPTYNRLPYLIKCLESIFCGFKDYPYEIVIADGGSTDGTLEYLRNLDKVRLIEQGKLTGAVKASNECFKAAKGDYIFLATDDFVIFPDVIRKACDFMEKEKQIGLIGPKMQEPKYGNLHNVLLWVKPYWILSPKIYIFRASVLKEIGYLDEHFRTYYVDVDAPLKVLKLGYSIAVTREVGIVHHRLHDQNVNIAKAANIKGLKSDTEFQYLCKKWEKLQIKLEDYMSNYPLKKRKSLFFKRLCATMYHSKRLRSFVKINQKLSMHLFDWFLKQTVIFKDKNFTHKKDFFLVQKYPDEIISALD